MFFEAMDLYRTLDLKFNPMDSSHFENNFKRTINCPKTRASMNKPGKWMTYWRYSGDSRMEKVVALRAMEKSRRGNIYLSPAGWFSTVMKIDLLWLNLSNPT